MAKYYFLFLFSILFLFLACRESTNSEKISSVDSSGNESFQLIPVVENIGAPVAFAHAGDERIFVVEQPGVVRIIKGGKIIDKPFLDISGKVESGSGYSEKGLLGIAFHPQYKTNGRFFIYYSSPSTTKGSDHTSIVAEYTVSSSTADIANINEKIILKIEQPESNHNGGQLAFGPDGYLYIASGDGGGAGDKHGETGNGQNLATLLGKILRIDINSKAPYAIPADNPFVNDVRAKPEIWAYGLRNPWRFSFDKKNGTMFCGDVGQNSYEEIDIIEKGKNYGWRALEGTHAYDEKIQVEDMQAPIYEYPRNVGISVIGGYVYRGKEVPQWDGKYFFADWNGKIFYLEKDGTGIWKTSTLSLGAAPGSTINSLGEDNQGEIYVLGQLDSGVKSKTGFVYKLAMVK